MRFLILAALVAVAAADYHDDTFHFSTLGSSSGLKRTTFQTAQPQPILAKKTVYQSGPLVSAFAPQPVFQAPQSVITKKTITKTYQSAPLIAAQPAFDQRFIVKQEVAQPAFEQRFIVQQPAVEQKFTTVKQYTAQPAVAAFRQQQTYAPEYQAPKWRILSQVQEVDPSGPYKLSYATENGIQVNEEGSLIAGADGPVVAAQGSYAFTGDDGVAYSVSYIADDNGFRAVGDHLPTPPPIPAEILKSLEENAASGEQYDDQGRLLKK
uniref:Endocuticle structural glycoprotein SgAbd-2 n=1 Tax=Aceria tosichella TaxID=561515 RepID=A0A6G1SQ12_9ACAR